MQGDFFNEILKINNNQITEANDPWQKMLHVLHEIDNTIDPNPENGESPRDAFIRCRDLVYANQEQELVLLKNTREFQNFEQHVQILRRFPKENDIEGLAKRAKKLEKCNLRVKKDLMNSLSAGEEAAEEILNRSSFSFARDGMTRLPKAIIEFFGRFKKLTVLDLAINRLTSLPDDIGLLSSLTSLDLSQNRLKEVPATIGMLVSLKVLDLSANELRQLPASIGIDSLQELNLEKNRLSSIPESITKLRQLRVLNLNGNQLERLPDSMALLQRLESLTLEDNNLKEVPNDIAEIGSLKQFDANNNELSDLPVRKGLPWFYNTLSTQRNGPQKPKPSTAVQPSTEDADIPKKEKDTSNSSSSSSPLNTYRKRK